VLTASLAGAVVSGAPSTLHAVVTGRSPLAAARAAGTLLPGRHGEPGLAAGLVVHAAVSVGWGTVLAAVLPRRHQVAWGTAGGLAIAALDLGAAGRRFPAVRALPQWWQWADHAVFGAVTGWILSRSDATSP